MATEAPLRLISADSQQVYRGLDIGTAKAPAASRAAWGLVDVADPGQAFSAGEFCRLAAPLCEKAWAEGRVPTLVGGTGLYLKALLEGLAEIPPVPEALRRGLIEELESRGLDALLAQLDACDPSLSKDLDRRNPRRVLRALEVYKATGRPLSAWQTDTTHPALVPQSCRWFGLDPGKEILDQRIAVRVDECLAAGWKEEARGLAQHWGAEAVRRSKAIGYAEMLDLLEGRLGAPAAREAIVTRTRQYARRQRTWFKAQKGIQWHASVPDQAHRLAWLAG